MGGPQEEEEEEEDECWGPGEEEGDEGWGPGEEDLEEGWGPGADEAEEGRGMHARRGREENHEEVWRAGAEQTGGGQGVEVAGGNAGHQVGQANVGCLKYVQAVVEPTMGRDVRAAPLGFRTAGRREATRRGPTMVPTLLSLGRGRTAMLKSRGPRRGRWSPSEGRLWSFLPALLGLAVNVLLFPAQELELGVSDVLRLPQRSVIRL